MSDLHIYIGTVYSDLPFQGKTYFFNSEAYLNSFTIPRVIFEVHDSKQVRARIAFFHEGSRLLSPYRATFGGLEMSDNLSIHAVELLITSVKQWATEHQVEKISINSYPYAYDNSVASIFSNVFYREMFCASKVDVNFHLPIQQKMSLKDFLNASEKNKLNKANKQDFRFTKLTVQELGAMYEVIKNNRNQKGYPISMSSELLENACRLHPDIYHLFGVYNNESILAAVAVCVKVREDILYTFYLADLIEERTTTPIVFLIDQLYNYCKRNQFTLLDLGIATENSLFNHGLADFKKNLGAELSLKLTFDYLLVK